MSNEISAIRNRAAPAAAAPAVERPPGRRALAKAPTGIGGLDEITGGGLPRGRPTLICGTAGCGKTLFGLEFLVRGAVEHGEPGLFVSFEESSRELAENVASIGFDLDELMAQGKLSIDHVQVERSEIEETGEYDLDGLFVRLGLAIDTLGARRIVLDTLEALFAALPNEAILRAELRRLFRWLKDRGLTAVITGERGGGALTRHGLEEYVSDCVILLDQRVQEQITTRRLRIVKYRGSLHGTNEYPFLIHERGISVLPVTSAGLEHQASTERVSTGIQRLDTMLGGQGLYRGSSVLISGTSGAGKSSLAAHAAAAACARGERCLYLAFEESQSQIVRNMRTIGVDLATWVERGLLRFHASRPTAFGLEMHLALVHRLVEDFDPAVMVIDPMTNLAAVGSITEVRVMLTRLIDFLKGRGITAFFTSLTEGGEAIERTEAGISSLMDSWLLIRMLEGNGERNRGLYVLKSRGMPHSNQIREIVIGSGGIEITDVYGGAAGALTGAARRAQEAQERAEAALRRQEVERRQRALERRRQVLRAQMAVSQAELEAEEQEVEAILQDEARRAETSARDREEIARLRRVDGPGVAAGGAASIGARR